jgi:hypothetical protein
LALEHNDRKLEAQRSRVNSTQLENKRLDALSIEGRSDGYTTGSIFRVLTARYENALRRKKQGVGQGDRESQANR